MFPNAFAFSQVVVEIRLFALACSSMSFRVTSGWWYLGYFAVFLPD